MKYICHIFLCLLCNCLFAQSPRFVFPVADNKEIEQAVFSADNRFLLTQGEENANVWDHVSGKLLYTHNVDYVSNSVFSNDGRFLASGFKDEVLITEIRSGQQYSINTGTETQKTIRFSRDGSMILVGRYDSNSVRLWSNPDGKLLHTFKGSILTTAFSHSDNHLIIRTKDTLQKWDLRKMELSKSLVMTKPFHGLKLSLDGESVVTFKDKTIFAWNFNSTTPIREININKSGIADIEFSGDGKRLVSYGKDSTAIIVDILSGNMVRNIKFRTLENGSCISHDGKRLAVYYEKLIILYDIDSGTITDSISNNLGGYYNEETLAFSSNGEWLSWGNDEQLFVYSTRTKLSHKLESSFNKVNGALLSPGNKYLLSMSESATLWDISSAKPITNMSIGRDGYDCEFNNDGTKLLMWDGRDMELFSIPEGKRLMKVRSPRYGKISRPFISGDGKKIGLVDSDEIRMWNDSLKASLHSVYRKTSTIAASVIFNFDGNYFLTANKDSVLFYLSDKGTLLKKFVRSDSDSAFIFTYISRDDKYMMTHDARHLHATVWDIASGKKLYNINSDNPRFTMDAKYIIGGSTVHDIATGRPLENSEKSFTSYPLQIPIADKFITEYSDHEILKRNLIKITEVRTGYSYYLLSLSLDQYLVFDEDGRFDGTPEARAQLSLACGDKILDKSEGHDKLWVPGLVEKLMRGEEIKGKTLSDLAHCK